MPDIYLPFLYYLSHTHQHTPKSASNHLMTSLCTVSALHGLQALLPVTFQCCHQGC